MTQNFKVVMQIHVRKFVICMYCVLLTVQTIVSFAQTSVLKTQEYIQKSKAQQNFYEGINLLNFGYVAESTVAFQRAVSLEPNNLLIRYWLARANNAYGYNEFSRRIFIELLNKKFQPSYISSQIELMSLKTHGDTSNLSDFVRVVSIDVAQRYNFIQPMALKTSLDGNIFLTAIGSSTIAKLDLLASFKKQYQKTVALIDKPTDIVQLSDGTILVAGFTSNKIYKFSEGGVFIGEFIQDVANQQNINTQNKNINLQSIGRNVVMPVLIGPQYLTSDMYGDVYVSAFGSSKIFKFSSNGNFLFTFGNKGNGKLQSPTGIVAFKDKVWILDNRETGLFLLSFDVSGNFLVKYFIGYMKGEGISFFNNNLYISAQKKIVQFDIMKNKVTYILSTGEFSKVVSSTFDDNGVLWVGDQNRNKIEAFSKPTEQYAGLETRVVSLNSKSFPTLTAYVTVRSALGRPISGLRANNFILFEDNETVKDLAVAEKEQVLQNIHGVIIPLEITNNSDGIKAMESILQFSNEIEKDATINTKISVLSRTFPPSYETKENSSSALIIDAMNRSIMYSKGENSKENLVTSLRFAINTLTPFTGKKTIIFIGRIPKKEAFQNAEWQRILNTAQYHNIMMYWIDIGGGSGFLNSKHNAAQDIFIQILKKTHSNKATTQYVFQYPYISLGDNPTLLQRMSESLQGTYTIRFKSKYKDTLFLTDKYISFIVEAYYFNRSGKDISGYVAP